MFNWGRLDTNILQFAVCQDFKGSWKELAPALLHLNEAGNILFHCKQGRVRSATVFLACVLAGQPGPGTKAIVAWLESEGREPDEKTAIALCKYAFNVDHYP